MMMSQDLVTELLRHCKSEFGIDLGPSSGPRDVLAAELGMLKCLVQLGRAAMQRWCQQLGDGDRGSRATKDGVPYRRVGKRPKTIHGLFGWVTYVRVCYARVEGGGTGWAPLDEQLGFQRGYMLGVSTSWPASAGASRTRRVWITSTKCSAPTGASESRCAKPTR